MIKVEWVLPRDGAVESGLEEGGPAVLVAVGAAAVGLAHAGDARVDALKKEKEKTFNAVQTNFYITKKVCVGSGKRKKSFRLSGEKAAGGKREVAKLRLLLLLELISSSSLQTAIDSLLACGCCLGGKEKNEEQKEEATTT